MGLPMLDSPFSKRYGYNAQPKEIAIREDAPEDLRFAFLDAVRDTAKEYLGGYPETDVRRLVSKRLRRRVDEAKWHYEDAWKAVEELVYGCEWFHVYNLIEDVHAHFEKRAPAAAVAFAEQMNEIFTEQGVGWQLVRGQVMSRAEEAFEAIVNTARAELKETGRPTAARRIHEALQDLSRRPEADYAGAISHALSALEAVVKDVTAQDTLTLGQVIAQGKLNTLVPSENIRESVMYAWRYANDEGARHGKEGKEPHREEAELIVGLAATVATYLSRKSR